MLHNLNWEPQFLVSDETDGEKPSLKKLSFLNAKSAQQDTALHLACTAGYKRSVQILIKHGADVNILADGKVSPLHLAAANGNIKVAKILLKHRAKINARDSDQMTPLHRFSIITKVLAMNC